MDDNIISTKMDTVIQILKENKKIEEKKLSNLANIEMKELDKWLKILEEEGYVIFEYTFTKKYIKWVEKEEENEDKYITDFQDEDVEIDAGMKFLKSEDSLLVDEKDEKQKNLDIPLEIKNNLEINTLKEEINKKIKTDRKNTKELDPKNINKEVEKLSKKIFEPIKIGEVEKIDDSFSNIDLKIDEKPTKTEEKLKEYLNRIEEQKMIILKLKEEKQKLLTEVYKPLEIKVETQLSILAQKIFEKEQEIYQLEEKINQIPKKIKKFDQNQSKLIELEEKTNGIVKNTSDRINSLIDEIEFIRQNVVDRIEEGRYSIKTDLEKIDEINQTIDKINKTKNQMDEKLMQIEKIMRTQQEMHLEVKEKIQEINLINQELKIQYDKTSENLNEESKKLDDLSEEVIKIESIQNWVSEYKKDYEEKIKEFSDFVKENSIGFQNLKVSLNQEFLDKYVNLLNETVSEYTTDFDNVNLTEKELDKKIENARQKLMKMIEKAREISKNQEKIKSVDTKKEFEEIISKGTKKINLIQNKSEESNEIYEVIQDTTKNLEKYVFNKKDKKRKKRRKKKKD